jgi:hypothetical protein
MSECSETRYDDVQGAAMSKHIGRSKRWTQQDSRAYTSALGRVVHERDGWYALLEYRTRVPPEREGGLPSWLPHSRRMGPFRRSRNAMVALEQEATILKNRQGEGILFGDQLGAEGQSGPDQGGPAVTVAPMQGGPGGRP